jgi:Bacterial Ig domain
MAASYHSLRGRLPVGKLGEMKIHTVLGWAAGVVVVMAIGVGCATTTTDRAPLSSYNNDSGMGAPPLTFITSPQDGATLPAGKSIKINAGANDWSGINRVDIYVNGNRIAQDFKRPYTAVLSSPAPGKYVIHSVAYSVYNSSRSSPGVVIQVR